MKKYVLYISFMVSLTALTSCFQDLDQDPAFDYPKQPPILDYVKPKLAFTFEDNSEDMSVYKATTQVVGNASYTQGKIKKAYQGADNSYILITPPTTPLNGGKSLHDVLSNLGSFSIAFWMNAEKPTKATGLFSLTNNKGFWSYIDLFMEPGNSTQTNGRFKLHLSNGTKDGWVDKIIPETLGKWVHLVFRYDATTGKFTIFRNGAEVHSQEFKTLGGIACPNLGTLVIGTLPFQTTPPLTTGAGAQGWAGFYKGQLDQFYFFNEPINDVQIKTLASEK